MRRELRPAGIIIFLAGVIVLASVFVAMAHTVNAGRHHAQIKSGIEQSHRGHKHVLARPRVARPAVGGSLLRYTRLSGRSCRAQFTYCKPGAKRTAAEVVVCRPAKDARDKPTCAMVSDGRKQVFCQFAFACNDRLDRSSRKAAAARVVNKVALLNSTHNQNSSLTPPAPPLKQVAGNPVEENSKIEATNIALLRAAQ